jgi:glycosyltransferase involved in cell wall biosynthesis
LYQDELGEPKDAGAPDSQGAHLGAEIVHLATSLGGGAGIAAMRLAEAQVRAGSPVRVVTRSSNGKSSIHESAIFKVDQVDVGDVGRVKSSAVTLTNLALQRRRSILFTPISLSFADRVSSSLRGARIAHFHNVYNLVRPADLVRISQQSPSVMTLHDERFLTGGCHYSLGCHRFETNCRRCPQSRLPEFGFAPPGRTHRRFLEDSANRLIYVAPSRWMSAQAVRAGIPKNRIYHVPNTVDTTLFSPDLRRQARSRLGIPVDDLVIAWQPGKGDLEMMKAFTQLGARMSRSAKDRIHIATTRGPKRVLPFRSTVITVTSEEERALFWAAADVGVSATQMDNFPNVVVESMAVGTPFVIPDVGGAAEAVRDTGGGLVATSSTGFSIAEALERLLHRPGLRSHLSHEASEGAKRLYGYKTILASVQHVYGHAVQEHRLHSASQ